MDRQDKKSKNWSLFGEPEDRAIASAKYKREMGTNPSYKTEQNAEVSRRARSMKNPTDRPYDAKEYPRLTEIAIAIGGKAPRSSTGNRVSERARLESLRSARAALDKKPVGAVKVPKPRMKPDGSGVKSAPIKVVADTPRAAPKTTNYQRMQAKQLEKEGYAGRSLTRAQAQKMAGAKSGANTTSLMVLFGISKPKTEKKVAAPTKRTGPLKSAFAQISYQGRKK